MLQTYLFFILFGFLLMLGGPESSKLSLYVVFVSVNLILHYATIPQEGLLACNDLWCQLCHQLRRKLLFLSKAFSLALTTLFMALCYVTQVFINDFSPSRPALQTLLRCSKLTHFLYHYKLPIQLLYISQMFVDHFLFSWSFPPLQIFLQIAERKYCNCNSQCTLGEKQSF